MKTGIKEVARDKKKKKKSNKAKACFNVEQNEPNMEQININLHIFLNRISFEITFC